jgi:hypothetical protein
MTRIAALLLFVGLWLAGPVVLAQTPDTATFERLMGRPFVIVPEGSQTESADWKRCADLVSAELEQRRMKRVATLADAEFVVFLQCTDGQRPSMQIVVAEAKPYRDEKRVVTISRISAGTGSGFKGTLADFVPGVVEAIFVHL